MSADEVISIIWAGAWAVIVVIIFWRLSKELF